MLAAETRKGIHTEPMRLTGNCGAFAGLSIVANYGSGYVEALNIAGSRDYADEAACLFGLPSRTVSREFNRRFPSGNHERISQLIFH